MSKDSFVLNMEERYKLIKFIFVSTQTDTVAVVCWLSSQQRVHGPAAQRLGLRVSAYVIFAPQQLLPPRQFPTAYQSHTSQRLRNVTFHLR